MGTDNDTASDRAAARLVNADRICRQFDHDGNGNDPAEVAEYPYAVIITGRGKASRVIWAADLEDLASIHIACIRGDDDHEREQVSAVYSTDSGEKLDQLAASVLITVVAEVGGVRSVSPDEGAVARLLDSGNACVSLSQAQFRRMVEWAVTWSDDMAPIDMRRAEFTVPGDDDSRRRGIVGAQGDKAIYIDADANSWDEDAVEEVISDRLPDDEAMRRIHDILSGEMWCGADDMPAIAEIVEATGRTIEEPAED